MRILRNLRIAILFMALPAIVQAQSVIVTDQAGRTVEIDQPVERVVTTFIPATLFTLCAGLKKQLVGASNKDSTSSIYEALIDQDNPPTLVGNRGVGLNLETIVSLKPDLVVMYGQKDGVQLADRLTALGFPAIVIVPEGFQAMKDTLDLVGRAAGTKEHTDRVLAAMDRVETRVSERVEMVGRPKVYYAASNILRTVSGHMLQNEMIRLAGGQNVSRKVQGFFANISKEQLLSWNPELIFLSDRISNHEANRLSTVEFSGMSAVKESRVNKVPSGTHWDFPSPLAMAGVIWMSSQIHSDLYAGIDWHSEVDQLYDTIFGAGFAAAHPAIVGKQQ